MAITLTKGQRIDLTKGNPGLQKVLVGLGWDPVKSRGFFGFKSQPIDCDASVFMLDGNGRRQDLVYFGQLKSKDGSIQHAGDNLTGEGDGDDEQLFVNLQKIPNSVQKLAFVVNIYEARQRSQSFGDIKNAYIRIADESNGSELVRFNLSEDYKNKTAIIAGELYREQGEWKFNAIGDGTTDNSLSDMARRY